MTHASDAGRAVLAAARATAARAALERRRPAPAAAPAPVRPVGGPAGLETQQRLVCRSATIRCAACRGLIGLGNRMRAAGTGVVHDSPSCVANAAPLEARSLPSEQSRKVVVLQSRVSSERVESALRCMLQACPHAHAPMRPRLLCARGCGLGVHAVCVGISKAHADVGQLVCGVCRARDMAGGADPPPLLVKSAVKSMLWEISVGQHSTAQGRAEFQRLERSWVESVGGGGVTLPRDSEESMVAFLIWLAADSGRARSFETVWRAAAGVCARTRDVQVTKSVRVKATHADLVKRLGELAVPCTQTTRRLLRLMLGLGGGPATLAGACLRSRGGQLILARSRVLTVLEVMGGMRVGEATGDTHGLLANDVAILTPATSTHVELGVTIEAKLHDSKTGPGRYVNFVGTSRSSGVESEKYLRALWAIYGLASAEVKYDGGFKIERPDYSVLRVDLLVTPVATTTRLRAELERELAAPSCAAICAHAKTTLRYLRRGLAAQDVSEERRYVHVAGGAAGGQEIASAHSWLAARGLASVVARVPGPLLRATEPGSGKLTHMPLQTESTYTHHIGALKAAYDISAKMEDPDLELELQGEERPHWANHSNRRFADRVARETSARSDVTAMDIDVVFGWNEAQRNKDMQLHYQGLDRAQRVRRARVTMYV